MGSRSIKRIIPAQRVNMGGIMLDQPLPFRGVDQIDPFLLVHHWDQEISGGKTQKDVGVGPHPHRGFAPVTFIFKGGVHHRDSRGGDSIVLEGGTQWMNSGMGIVHSERPIKSIAENGGQFEIIQFWVNAPSDKKMSQPSYQPLSKEETVWFNEDDGKVNIGLVAGELKNSKGKIDTYSDLLILRLELSQSGKTTIPINKDFNAFVYQLDGSLSINSSSPTKKKDLTWLENDGDLITIEALEDTRAIVLAGKPINEPLATYGPFVMNSQTEIMQAMRDYQMGKMGVLIEDFE